MPSRRVSPRISAGPATLARVILFAILAALSTGITADRLPDVSDLKPRSDRGLLPGRVHRIRDIPTAPGSFSDPSAIVAGNRLYFIVTGTLWTSDGSTEGTRPVPGTEGLTRLGILESLGDALLFNASDGSHGTELWRTDGTREGTRMVRDINPGPAGSNIPSMVPFRGEGYFGADDGVHGSELWKTDGTADGTVLVADVIPGPIGSTLINLKPGAEELYFAESSFLYRSPSPLYSSNGTEAGTRLLRYFVNDGSSELCAGLCFGLPSGAFTSFGAETFFIASDGVSGLELWRTDGTLPGTVLVKDICPGPCSGFFSTYDESRIDHRLLQVFHGRLYFFANDGMHGFELWTSDGTEAGTRLVRDIQPGPATSSIGGGLVPGASFLAFPVLDSPRWEMWRTDGTDAGTFSVASEKGQQPDWITVAGDIYFSAGRGSGPRQLWKIDSSGTSAVVVSDAFFDPVAPAAFRDSLYFLAKTADGGLSLWKTAGPHQPPLVPWRP